MAERIALSIPLVLLLAWFLRESFRARELLKAFPFRKKLIHALWSAAGLFFWAFAESIVIVVLDACPRVREPLFAALLFAMAVSAACLLAATRLVPKEA